MKVGDIVRRAARQTDGGTRYVLVEHHGTEGTIRPINEAPDHPGERVALADLVLAENAPYVQDPVDD